MISFLKDKIVRVSGLADVAGLDPSIFEQRINHLKSVG